MCFTGATNMDLSFHITDEIPIVTQLIQKRISKQVTEIFVDKTSLNYGSETNLSFIIAYEVPRLYLNEISTKYQRRLQIRTLENCS